MEVQACPEKKFFPENLIWVENGIQITRSIPTLFDLLNIPIQTIWTKEAIEEVDRLFKGESMYSTVLISVKLASGEVVSHVSINTDFFGSIQHYIPRIPHHYETRFSEIDFEKHAKLINQEVQNWLNLSSTSTFTVDVGTFRYDPEDKSYNGGNMDSKLVAYLPCLNQWDTNTNYITYTDDPFDDRLSSKPRSFNFNNKELASNNIVGFQAEYLMGSTVIAEEKLKFKNVVEKSQELQLTLLFKLVNNKLDLTLVTPF